MSKPNTLPTIADLYSDNIEQVARIEELTVLLNKAPKADWVKEHPYIKGYKYLPIDNYEPGLFGLTHHHLRNSRSGL